MRDVMRIFESLDQEEQRIVLDLLSVDIMPIVKEEKGMLEEILWAIIDELMRKLPIPGIGLLIDWLSVQVENWLSGEFDDQGPDEFIKGINEKFSEVDVLKNKLHEANLKLDDALGTLDETEFKLFTLNNAFEDLEKAYKKLLYFKEAFLKVQKRSWKFESEEMPGKKGYSNYETFIKRLQDLLGYIRTQ